MISLVIRGHISHLSPLTTKRHINMNQFPYEKTTEKKKCVKNKAQ